MIERDLLKEKLQAIAENEYKVPQNENPFTLALSMMNYIGDTDGYFRDDLIYSVLANWMLSDIFNKDELYQILTICLDDNHLFFKIGNVDDSVFTRTFSVLLLPIIIYIHRKKNFLSFEDLNMIKEKLTGYLSAEEDVRGYVLEKGWAHGVAHTADALDELAKCNEIGEADLKVILQAIHQKITINNYVYINDEDERMVTAVVSILDRGILTESDIINWLKGFSDINKIGQLPEDLMTSINTKNFVRSLYFRLLKNEENEKYTQIIKEVIDSISNF